MDAGNMNANEIMARIEAQVNAQMSEVFREQVTDKCFSVCADVSRKQMSSRESDCVDKYVPILNDMRWYNCHYLEQRFSLTATFVSIPL